MLLVATNRMVARHPPPRRDSRLHIVALAVLLLSARRAAPSVSAQGADASTTPLSVGGVALSGSLRTRVESWTWFGDSPNGTYTYPATLLRLSFARAMNRFDWNAEFSVPLLFALPEQPVGAGPAGLGANYFVANDRSRTAAGFFAKQAYGRIKDLASVNGQSLKIGRMEFSDGGEVSPKDETLAAVKRDRVAARLLANFGFTHVQRSFDGAQYGLDRPTVNLTILVARPTRGVFQVDGWGELNIDVLYGAVTRQLSPPANASEWRVFGLWYHDARAGVVKTDNRPLDVRQSDGAPVTIGTFGGHYIRASTTEHGVFDVLLWTAGQTGAWGALRHRAGAFALEAGWQPTLPLRPWLRGGLDYASGDSDPNDSSHGTFFQALPTPRLYARFPFFNLMNSADAFGQLLLRPTKRVSTRIDIHSLRVADGNDLWYQGGGAFQPATFGYVGQRVNGQTGLATLYDGSADLTVTSRATIEGYYAYASGRSASGVNYPTSNRATLAYLELLVRF
jgi:hypothetical protein